VGGPIRASCPDTKSQKEKDAATGTCLGTTTKTPHQSAAQRTHLDFGKNSFRTPKGVLAK
jgi:hypothetical protein